MKDYKAEPVFSLNEKVCIMVDSKRLSMFRMRSLAKSRIAEEICIESKVFFHREIPGQSLTIMVVFSHQRYLDVISIPLDLEETKVEIHHYLARIPKPRSHKV